MTKVLKVERTSVSPTAPYLWRVFLKSEDTAQFVVVAADEIGAYAEALKVLRTIQEITPND